MHCMSLYILTTASMSGVPFLTKILFADLYQKSVFSTMTMCVQAFCIPESSEAWPHDNIFQTWLLDSVHSLREITWFIHINYSELLRNIHSICVDILYKSLFFLFGNIVFRLLIDFQWSYKINCGPQNVIPHIHFQYWSDGIVCF